MTEKLYHYTSAAGLKGIIETGVIFLTDIDYLNDFSEFQHFLELTRESYEEKKETLPKKATENIEKWLNHCFTQYKEHRIYVASFSTEPDSLPQWRGYSQPGGFNIGFDKANAVRKIERRNSGDDEHSLFLKVNYDPEVSKQQANNLVDEFINANNHGQLNDLDAMRILYPKFCKLAVSNKHRAFKEECEWRFISIGRFQQGSKPAERKIRVSNGQLIPYIELGIKDKELKKLTIESITIGPGSNFELQKHALESYLQEKGESHITIKNSKAPYKSK